MIAVESDRKRQFQRDMGATGDALVNAVFAATGAGKVASQLSNAVFEGFDSTYQNIQEAFMVSPDLAAVRKLVHEAQRNFKADVAAAPPTSYEAARQVIERYAGTCSYTGMKQLVNDSVDAQSEELAAAATAKNLGTAGDRANPGAPAQTPPATPDTGAQGPVQEPAAAVTVPM